MAVDTLLTSLGLPEADETKLPIINTISEASLLKNEIEKDQEDSGRSYFDSLSTAYDENFSVSSALDSLEKADIDVGTPVTNFTPELVTQLTSDLPIEASKEILDEAQNYGISRAMKQREFFLKTLANRKQLEADGVQGIVANAFSVMFDPAEWSLILGLTAAATATTTPVGGAAALAAGTIKQAYNVKKAFKIGALVTGAESAAFEALRADTKYDIDINDVMIAGGFGALLGGSLNAGRIAFQRAGQRSLIASKVVKGQQLTPDEKIFHDEFNVDVLATKIIDKELEGEKFIESINGINGQKTFNDLEIKDVEAIPKIAGWNMFGLRKLISTGARGGSSDLGFVRFATRVLGANFTGYVGGKTFTKAGGSASEIAESLQGVYRMRLSNLYLTSHKQWKKRTGLSAEEFNQAVTSYVRGIDRVDVPEEVVIVGKEHLRLNKEIGYEAVESDVAGFTKKVIDNNDNYMPRIIDNDKIQALRAKYGNVAAEKNITDLVETAIRKEQLDIEDQVAKMLLKKKKVADIDTVNDYIFKIARGYARGIITRRQMNKGIQDSSEMSLDDFGAMLKVNLEGITDDEIETITDMLTKSITPKGHTRSKARLVLNEGTVIKVANKDGELEDLAFTDLLVNDSEQLINSYIFQMSGAIGLARNGINTNAPKTSFKDLLAKIDEERIEKNLTEEQVKEEVDAIQFMYDGITGNLRNRKETQNLADMNIAIRAYSFAVNMGMSGMSALMELSNSMFEYSFMTILKSAPEYKKLFQLASQGRLPDGVMREVTEAFGIGNEVAFGKWNKVTRMDTEDVGVSISPERGGYNRKGASLRKLGEVAGDGAYGAQKHVAYWSGLTGVTQTLRRLSMLHFTNEWALAARKGKLPFDLVKRQQLGITDEMGDKLLKVMNSKLVEKFPNGTVKKLNIVKWDKDVREFFSAIGFKDARTNVQETNIASSNRFLKGTQVGRSMFQFMNFTLGSFEQQTQRLGVRVSRGDATVGKVLLSAAAMGGLMYVARVQLNAVGRSDADEYIKERMKPENWAIGALSQIGAASMFSYIYQLTTGAMNGNTYAITPPVVSIGQNILSTVANVADENSTTEAEWRKGLRLAPYQSLYGVRQIFNGVADEASRYFR